MCEKKLKVILFAKKFDKKQKSKSQIYCSVITLFFEINKPMKISYTKHSVITLNHLKNPCFENVEKKSV